MNSFVDKAIEIFEGQIMWQTNPSLVGEAAMRIAACYTGRELRDYGLKLANAGLSDHDRQMLGAMYKIKARVLQKAGNWDLGATDPAVFYGKL